MCPHLQTKRSIRQENAKLAAELARVQQELSHTNDQIMHLKQPVDDQPTELDGPNGADALLVAGASAQRWRHRRVQAPTAHIHVTHGAILLASFCMQA